MIFSESCCNGDLSKVTEFTETYQQCLESGLEISCEKGHEYVFHFLTTHDAKDVNRSIKGACRGGQLHLIEIILDHYPIDLYSTLCMTFNEPTPTSVEYMINRVDQTCNFSTHEETLYKLFLHACECGDAEIALKLVNMGTFD